MIESELFNSYGFQHRRRDFAEMSFADRAVCVCCTGHWWSNPIFKNINFENGRIGRCRRFLPGSS